MAPMTLLSSARTQSRSAVAARRELRWLVMHRALRTMSQVQARRGLPLARLLVDPAVRLDPYPVHEEIRARGRLVQTPMLTVTTDHALTAALLRDPGFGVGLSANEFTPRLIRWALRPPDHDVSNVIDPPSLLAIDPPHHTRYRRLVSKPFTPRALAAVADRVEQRCAELLDGLAGRRDVDIVGEYAALLPVAVIAEILGVPEDMHAQFLRWGHAIAPVLDQGLDHRTYRVAERALSEINAWFTGHFARLRRAPGDDVLSALVNADPDDRLDDRELRATALLLLGAGFETTVNLLGNGIALLASDRAALDRLLAEPGLWPQAVEETLRIESPVQMTARIARQDRELGGFPVTAGTLVLTLLGAANRDPAVFPDPARFDLDRPNSREHVAFSGGIHFCLGASLARMEGATGLRMLFERFPDLRLAGPGIRRPLQTLRGYESLPVRLA